MADEKQIQQQDKRTLCEFGEGVYIKIILYGPGMATDRKDRGLRPKERKTI